MNRANFGQFTENLGVLKDFVELAKDPNKIIKAHQDAMKQFELTKEQEKKYNDFQSMTKKNEELLLSINEGKQQLSEMNINNDKRLQEISDKAKNLGELNANIIADKNNLEVAKKNHENSLSQMKNERAELDKLASELADRKKSFDFLQKALDERAQKIILREKASPL